MIRDSGSANKVSRRDKLLDNVKYGHMTPVEVEAEAVCLGLGKLASEPDCSQFDPMRETWWTLPMVVAWIAWRSPERVREFWDLYRSECWDWNFREWRDGPDGPVYAGHFLEQRRPATLSSLLFAELHDSAQGLLPHGTISINDAKAKLWEALGENSFQATGVSTDTGERTIIPDYAWRDLNDIEERGRDVLRLRESSGVWTHRGYHDVALRRQNIMAIWQPHRLDERGFRLPPLVKPEGSGYMPLYLAAQWIATRGGTVEIDPRDIVIWKDAFAMLLARMASEEVAVVGIRNGANEKIDGRLFAGIQVDYPFTDTSFSLLVSEELFLYSCPYLDDDHWRNGFDDRLESKNGVKWSRLMVLKSDIARWWPFDIASPTEVATLVGRTGAPGRPTSMHLVEVEHRARWQRGEAETGIGAEAAALSDWLQRAHPHAPRLKPKTIANRLRGEHRRLTADARK
jgi:hypothetical protein